MFGVEITKFWKVLKLRLFNFWLILSVQSKMVSLQVGMKICKSAAMTTSTKDFIISYNTYSMIPITSKVR